MTGVAENLLIGHSPALSGLFTAHGRSTAENSTNGDIDRFNPSAQTQVEESPSFWTRLVQRIVNTGRNIWSVIREFNPFTQFFNFCEGIRARRPIQEAENRNGLNIEDYQRSIQYTPGQNNDRALFRYYESDSDKNLIIIIVGNTEDLDTRSEFAERFHQAGHPVLVLRTGDAGESLRNRFFLSNDFSSHTAVVYTHNRNIINDARNRIGIFSGLRSQGADIIAHSFGGGTAIEYTNEAGNASGIPIRRVACTDPVRLGHYHLGRTERRSPQQIPYLHIYQGNSYFLNGEAMYSGNPQITSVHIPRVTHTELPWNQRVQDMIFNFITRRS